VYAGQYCCKDPNGAFAFCTDEDAIWVGLPYLGAGIQDFFPLEFRAKQNYGNGISFCSVTTSYFLQQEGETFEGPVQYTPMQLARDAFDIAANVDSSDGLSDVELQRITLFLNTTAVKVVCSQGLALACTTSAYIPTPSGSHF